MGFFDKLKNEFIDIIEWTNPDPNTLVWKFPRYQNEIKNGAQLTVRPGQAAVLVNEGQLADIFTEGRHELTTANIPILSTIKGWKYGFNSPFKVDIYFVATKQFMNLKWGTPQPIMLRDPELGPIQLRANGSYCVQVEPSRLDFFLRNVAGSGDEFTIDGVSEQLRNLVITGFTDYLGESKINAFDLAAQFNEFSKALHQNLIPEFGELSLNLTKFLLASITFPEKVQEAIDRRTSVGLMGGIDNYMRANAADSMIIGAQNGGHSMAGDMMGMGIGMAMAGQMANGMMGQGGMMQGGMMPQQGAAVPPPIQPQALYYVAVNGQQTGPFQPAQLQQMFAAGQFNQQSQVWTQGMPAWAAASTVAALAFVFQQPQDQTPPPPPPVM